MGFCPNECSPGKQTGGERGDADDKGGSSATEGRWRGPPWPVSESSFDHYAMQASRASEVHNTQWAKQNATLDRPREPKEPRALVRREVRETGESEGGDGINEAFCAARSFEGRGRSRARAAKNKETRSFRERSELKLPRELQDALLTMSSRGRGRRTCARSRCTHSPAECAGPRHGLVRAG